MARPSVRTSLNGKRPGVSHAKPPAEDPERDDDDDRPQEVTAADDVPAGPPPVDALSEMMAGLQGASSARITVYRVVKNQPQSYMFETDPAGFSLDDLRDKYNGGEFRLYVTRNGQLWKNMRVVVEPKSARPGMDAAPQVTQVSDMMSMMRDSLAQQTTMIRDMIGMRQASPFANMDLPAIITAAAAALTALRPPPAPPPVPQPDVSEKALDMFMRGMEIANSIRDNSGDGGGLGGVLRDVLRSPIVEAAVRSQMGPQPSPATHPVAPPALPHPAQVSHAKPADPQPQPQDENKVLAYYIGFLTGKAQAGADPSLYAELVLDNVPESQLTPLLAMGDSGLVDYMIQVNPAAAPHRAWFALLVKEINSLLEPDDDSTQQPGAGNATDTTSSVVPGQSA